jgi:hypothetical protein
MDNELVGYFKVRENTPKTVVGTSGFLWSTQVLLQFLFHAIFSAFSPRNSNFGFIFTGHAGVPRR